MVSPPHLLTLPREIRNQIYTYLHHDLELRGIQKLGASQVFVRLTSVPETNICLVHSRLHIEYLESGPITSTNAIIFNRNLGTDTKYWTHCPITTTHHLTALSHTKTATLRFSPNPMLPCATPLNLLSALVRLAPNLHSLRIAECIITHLFIDTPLPTSPFPSPHPEKLDPLPLHISTLLLRQRTNCQRITTRSVSEPGYRVCDEHVVAQCRTHFFSSSSSSSSSSSTSRSRSRSRSRSEGKGRLLVQGANHASRWSQWDVVFGVMPDGFVEWSTGLSRRGGVRVRARRERVVGWVEEDFVGGEFV